MSFDPSCLVSQLSAINREEGDIELKCQGGVVKAHSLILKMRYSITEWCLESYAHCKILTMGSINKHPLAISSGVSINPKNLIFS